MKINLGCGQNKLQGYVNIDKFAGCRPDRVMDLEVTPWDMATDSVDEVVMNHCLEHLGQDANVFLAIMRELYRVCKAGTFIRIHVPHPRHRNFLNDPTHVRAITPEMFSLFSKKNCQRWAEIGAANTPLALHLDVDFEVYQFQVVIEQKYLDRLQTGELTEQQLIDKLEHENNIASEFQITLQVLK